MRTRMPNTERNGHSYSRLILGEYLITQKKIGVNDKRIARGTWSERSTEIQNLAISLMYVHKVIILNTKLSTCIFPSHYIKKTWLERCVINVWDHLLNDPSGHHNFPGWKLYTDNEKNKHALLLGRIGNCWQLLLRLDSSGRKTDSWKTISSTACSHGQLTLIHTCMAGFGSLHVYVIARD